MTAFIIICILGYIKLNEHDFFLFTVIHIKGTKYIFFFFSRSLTDVKTERKKENEKKRKKIFRYHGEGEEEEEEGGREGGGKKSINMSCSSSDLRTSFNELLWLNTDIRHSN